MLNSICHRFKNEVIINCDMSADVNTNIDVNMTINIDVDMTTNVDVHVYEKWST
jgi:hypothetical protein